MVRFFVSSEDVCDGVVRLGAADCEHIRALRLRPSELFAVCNGEGTDYICRLSEHEGTTAVIVETRTSAGEPSINCIVYLALSKGDRLEYAVQKSVELGAAGIVLFPSQRCVAVPSKISKKITRLERIALEASKQSGRGRVPAITDVESFETAVIEAARAQLPLFCYEDENRRGLKEVLESQSVCGSVSVVTGPEGGFEPCEAQFAADAGMISVSLGRRLLRCETAPIAVLAAVMCYAGEMR